jgi:hypothetical protein
MNRYLFIGYRKLGCAIVLSCAFFCSLAQSSEAKALFDKVEEKRKPWPKMFLSVRLREVRDTTKAARYDVYVNHNKTLVVFEEPKEQKGILLLLSEGDLWLYITGTRKPMKIMPLQRLAGAVSYVDLVNMGWRDAYEITKEQEMPGQRFQLILKARAKENSFQVIDLLIDRKLERPVKANVYLSSGKLFKTLEFSRFQTYGGKEINTGVLFTDYFDNGVKTVAEYGQVKKEYNVPESYFDKDSLAVTSKKLLVGQ